MRKIHVIMVIVFYGSEQCFLPTKQPDKEL